MFIFSEDMADKSSKATKTGDDVEDSDEEDRVQETGAISASEPQLVSSDRDLPSTSQHTQGQSDDYLHPPAKSRSQDHGSGLRSPNTVRFQLLCATPDENEDTIDAQCHEGHTRKRRHSSGRRPVQDTRPGSGTLPCLTGPPRSRFLFANVDNSPPVSPSWNHHNSASPFSPYRDTTPRCLIQCDKNEPETTFSDMP